MDERPLEAVITELEQLLEGSAPSVKPDFDLATNQIVAAVAGAELEVPEFCIAPGLAVRQTFTHIMVPMMAAFAPPARQGAPHPAPWVAGDGGRGFDCHFEIILEAGIKWPDIDRLNVVWLVAALLRLHSAAPLRCPAIANMPFEAMATAQENSQRLLPMELHWQTLITKRPVRQMVRKETLRWVSKNFQKAQDLLRTPSFANALTAYDSSIWQPSIGSAIITLWAAVEALYRPGQPNTTKRLAQILSASISEEPTVRHKMFELIRQLYQQRGGAAHAAQQPPPEIWLASQLIARPAFISCIEAGTIPNPAELLVDWKRTANVSFRPL